MRTVALSRYTKFLQGLRSSPSHEVRVMYGVVSGDVQSTTGHNLSMIKLETGLDPTKATSWAVKQQLVRKTPAVPERDRWRLGYLAKMLEARGEAFYAGKETELLSILIDSLCSS